MSTKLVNMLRGQAIAAAGVPWSQRAAPAPLADLRAITAVFQSAPGPFVVHTNRALLERGRARFPNRAFIRAALAYLDAHPELETPP